MRRRIDVRAVLTNPDTWSLSPPRRPTTRRIDELRARSRAQQRFAHMREIQRVNAAIFAADTRLRELTPGSLDWCAARLRRNGSR